MQLKVLGATSFPVECLKINFLQVLTTSRYVSAYICLDAWCACSLCDSSELLWEERLAGRKPGALAFMPAKGAALLQLPAYAAADMFLPLYGIALAFMPE